jgi:hypothetical protein
MRRVSAMLGHFRFHWSWALYTQCVFLSIQFTHGSKYMYECRHAFSGARLCWTVAECLGSTYGPYVVSLHTQRRGKQRWQGAWKSQYAKERILIWVLGICSWNARDLPTWPETNTRRILHMHKNAWNQSHRVRATTIASSMYLTFTSQLWAECNIENVALSSTFNHFARSTSTGAIPPSRVKRVSISSLLHRCVEIYINQTTSFS